MKIKTLKKHLSLLLTVLMIVGIFPNGFTVYALGEENHSHSEACYAAKGDLLCDLSENEGHTHTDDCKCPGGEYICGQIESEGHVHDESCYEYDDENASPSNASSPKLICGEEESAGHTHTEECVCPGGELICGKDESEGHTHGEDCYAKGGELICDLEETSFYASDSDIEVTTAEELKAAFDAAETGDIVTLGADIAYDQSTLKTITVSKDITLDCNGYKISVDDALFEIAETGDLTLVNAQIEATDEDIIDTIRAGGALTIVSTFGGGIVTNDDFIEDNYGKVYIKDGTFRLGYSVVYECYGTAEVIIENADMETKGCVIGYLEDAGCSLYIKNGSYTVENYIVSGTYGQILIEAGTFQSIEDCFDSIYSGTVTIKGGNFTAGNTENEYYCFDIYKNGDQPSATVNIDGGTFASTSNTIRVADNSVVNISNGIFTSDTNAVYADGNAQINLSGGTFINQSDGKAFELEGQAVVNIEEGFLADPADWQEAAQVSIYPAKFDVVFFDMEGTEFYRETVKTNCSVANWPAQPESPGKEYRWWGWVDANGNRYDSSSVFTSATDIYAKFIKEGLPVDPDKPITPEEPEKPDIPEYPDKPSGESVVVTSYEELKKAIEDKKSSIRISEDIVFPSNGVLNVTSDVYITADKGTTVTGPGVMFNLAGDTTMTVEGMEASADSGNVFKTDSDSVCNIISGKYSAPDDVIFGTSDTAVVNLYGGRIEERSGSDGPIYRAKLVYMNHTKNGSGSNSVIEVVPMEQYTVTFYDGEEILKSVRVYENAPLTLPEIQADDFLGWFDGDGNQYFNNSFINSDLTLYATYKKAIVTITFIVDGEAHKAEIPSGSALSTADGFSLADVWQDKNGFAWDAASIVEHDLVLYAADTDNIVRTLDEFKAALMGTNNSIIVGAEIPVTETLVVNRSVSISAIDGGSLIRPEGFTDVLLKIETKNNAPTEVTIGNLLIDGKNIEAQAPAVSLDSTSTLTLRGATIRNNFNMADNWNDMYGGAVYSAGRLYIYEGTTLCSNKAYNGGAIEIDCDDETACLYLYGGDICHNSAWNTSGCEGGGGGVHIGNNEVTDYVAFYMYGGRIHHNKAESGSQYGTSSGGGVSLTCGDDGIHFVMYDGSITDNYTDGNGGAVYTGCSSMAMYDGVMARNVAEEYGGAVSTHCCDNTLFMYGGTITLNAAGICGGGVDATGGAPYTLLGNVYGNFAKESGDDIYAATRGNFGSILRKVNDAIPYENPHYVSGEMQELFNTLVSSRPDYKILKPIEGYDFTLSQPESIQHMGWFEDMASSRYAEGNQPIPTTNGSDGTSFKLQTSQDVKAVYGRFLLVYDANYGSGEYQYDPISYRYGAKAVTQQNMFERAGYKFVGWNERTDGSGSWYYPDLNGYNSISMNSNKVVYAQWLKVYSVRYEVTGDPTYGSPSDANIPVDGNQYISGDSVTVSPVLTSAWTTSDGTESGIPGTWTFTPWNKESGFQITGDTVIEGAWVFTPASGSLTVSKTISGSAASETQEFTFTVTLNDTAVNGTYGDMIFVNGSATFTLKANESKMASGLAHGMTYTVSESNNSGYAVTVNHTENTTAVGTILAGETAVAAFNNHKDKSGGSEGGSGSGSGGSSSNPARIVIRAEKTLDGKTPVGSDYSFALKDENGNVVQTVKNNGGSVSFAALNFSKTGTYTYTLAEITGTDSKTNYDSSIYQLIIKVTKASNYAATVQWKRDGQAYSGIPFFANTTKTVDDPSIPSNPNQPVNPDKPGNPDQPNDSDKPNTPTTPDKPAKPTDPAQPIDPVPQTGDETDIGMWLTLMLCSFVALVGVCVYERKRRYSGRHVRR